MEHCLQLVSKDSLDRLHILEGQRSVLQETVGDLAIDDLIHQSADALFRMLFQASRSGLDGIRHHQNSGLLREWVRSRISKQLLINLPIRIFILE